LIGASAALLGVWGTQWLTTRRESHRDRLRWAQERQQRELDSQKAAFAESLLAFDKWHSESFALALHLNASAFRAGNADRFPALEEAARSGLVAVDLVCSDEAIEATHRAFRAVSSLSFAVSLAVGSAQHDGQAEEGLRHQANAFASQAADAMVEMRKVYRAELAKQSGEPLVMVEGTKPRRKRLTREADPQRP
jgi:hypothetical protein